VVLSLHAWGSKKVSSKSYGMKDSHDEQYHVDGRWKMALAALIVAIIGAATGVVALAWNVATWRRQGPMVTLDAWFSGGNEITATAWNTGRSDAHIAHFSFMWTGTEPDDEEETLFANVSSDNVQINDDSVPAHGSAHLRILHLEQILGGLLLALENHGKVMLVARTGPREQVTTLVRYFFH
jgi:hypothetical protein